MSENIASLCKYITHGVYVIAVADDNKQNAFTASWVMQISFDPVLLVFSINPEHYSYPILQSGGICTINVLRREQMNEAEHFGRSGLSNKMAAYQWDQAKTGAPILANAICYFDCKVSHYCDAGDHQLVVCQVVDAAALIRGDPMLYSETGNLDGSDEIFPQ